MNDLLAVTTLSKVSQSASQNPSMWPLNLSEMVSAAKSKLEKHLDYLSERLVPFYLFSEEKCYEENDVNPLVHTPHSLVLIPRTSNQIFFIVVGLLLTHSYIFSEKKRHLNVNNFS